jgi:hypothetical protein
VRASPIGDYLCASAVLTSIGSFFIQGSAGTVNWASTRPDADAWVEYKPRKSLRQFTRYLVCLDGLEKSAFSPSPFVCLPTGARGTERC